MIPARLEPLVRADRVPVSLARLFAHSGRDLVLVGGGVRDALLGRAPVGGDDLDFATDARPDEIQRIIAPWADSVFTIGAEFGTIGGHKDGVPVEITTFRSEIYRDDSRKPKVTYSVDLAEDLSRRDFTVNAVALRLLPEPKMIDPTGGLGDLATGTLRTPLDPEVSFGDDPLRMVRLFRFVSLLGFSPDPVALTAVADMRERLDIVSAERVRDEMTRLLSGTAVTDALDGLVATRLMDHIVPEVTALALQQDPQHRHKDVLAHTIAVVGKCPPDPVLRLAALLHDIGKPDTREFGANGVSFHHHEVVGARLARARLKELRFSKETVDAVCDLVYLHMRAHTFKLGWTDRAVRRYVRDAGPLLDRLNHLVRCDVTTRDPRKERAVIRRIDELEERIADLRGREELDRIRPPIDGHAVMAFLGLSPGRVVGEAMEMLLEHRLDEGPYTEEDAFSLLSAWGAERGIERRS